MNKLERLFTFTMRAAQRAMEIASFPRGHGHVCKQQETEKGRGACAGRLTGKHDKLRGKEQPSDEVRRIEALAHTRRQLQGATSGLEGKG